MTFDWHNPYPSYRTPLMARNVVATSHPLATQAGVRMLMRGGSAVDAAIATAAALTVVEPCSNGLGSDAFAIVADSGRLHGLNAAGLSPAAWSPQHFDSKHGAGPAMPKRGWDSVTVPGAVSAWVALHERFGRLPFADLLEPAIELAERGHAVAVTVAWKWARAVPELQREPGFAETFMPRGRAPEPGERFVFADAGRTLRRIAESRGEDFYRGETAARIAEHAREHGALLTEADLASHRCAWVDLIAQDFAGHTVHQIPPSGQGIAALMALGMLQHLPLAEQPVDSVLAQHWQIEAMKLAFADTYRWVADPRAMREVTAADLLHPDYLRERARLIRADRASDFAHGTPPRGGTVYLSVADERGQMVSFIQSNFWGFGSGVVVPGTGVSLQNRGFGFTRERGHPNEVAGAKQPFHTIIHSWLSHPGWAPAHGLWRDGRQYAAPGPCADPGAPAATPPAPAGRLRRPALEGGHRPEGRPGAHHGRRAAARPDGPGPPLCAARRRLHGLWQRPVHLAPGRRCRRRLCGRHRCAPRWSGGGVLAIG